MALSHPYKKVADYTNIFKFNIIFDVYIYLEYYIVHFIDFKHICSPSRFTGKNHRGIKM